jgi:hypothetical protein
MIVFPLAAAAVALVFAVMLGRQYAANHRPFLVLWAIALLMFSAASFALFLGVLNGWSSAEYRTFYLFGAILNVPYLAMGQLYLMIPRRWISNVLMVALLAATAYATAVVRTAPVHLPSLAFDFPRGREVFGDGSTPQLLAQIFGNGGYTVVVLGTLWSAFRIRGRAAGRERFLALLMIALGLTLVAVGTGFGAAFRSQALFSTALLAGLVVMFVGFLRAGRPAPA